MLERFFEAKNFIDHITKAILIWPFIFCVLSHKPFGLHPGRMAYPTAYSKSEIYGDFTFVDQEQNTGTPCLLTFMKKLKYDFI